MILKAIFEGSIKVNGIEYADFREFKVQPANDKETAGRIYLPKNYIRKKVHVYLPKR